MIVIGSKALLFRLKQTEEVKQRQERSDYDVIMSIDEFDSWTELYKENIVKLYPTTSNKYKAIMEKDGKRKQYEIEIAFEGTSAALLLANERMVTDCGRRGFLNEPLYTLRIDFQLATKRAHIIYPVHWEKNINDYHLLKKLTAEENRKHFITQHYDLLKKYSSLRVAECKIKFSKFKTPKLMVTNDDFFSSKLNVPHYFVHDDMHKIMAHHDKPVYE
jgi:hypothetical protein